MIAERYAPDLPALVKWLRNRGRVCGGEQEDLESAAAEALLFSIRGFRAEYGVKFITYLVTAIERRCQAFVKGHVVSSQSRVAKRRAKQVSLSTPLRSKRGGDGTLLDTVAQNRRCEGVGDGPSEKAREQFWEQAVKRLPERLGRIILFRFRDGLTLDECGKRLGVTKERIRQLETRAMNKLKDDPTLGKRLDWESV